MVSRELVHAADEDELRKDVTFELFVADRSEGGQGSMCPSALQTRKRDVKTLDGANDTICAKMRKKTPHSPQR